MIAPTFKVGDLVRYRSGLKVGEQVWNESHKTYHVITKEDLEYFAGKTLKIEKVIILNSETMSDDFWYRVSLEHPRKSGNIIFNTVTGPMLVPDSIGFGCDSLI